MQFDKLHKRHISSDQNLSYLGTRMVKKSNQMTKQSRKLLMTRSTSLRSWMQPKKTPQNTRLDFALYRMRMRLRLFSKHRMYNSYCYILGKLTSECLSCSEKKITSCSAIQLSFTKHGRNKTKTQWAEAIFQTSIFAYLILPDAHYDKGMGKNYLGGCFERCRNG